MSRHTDQLLDEIRIYERQTGRQVSIINIDSDYLSVMWAEHVKTLADEHKNIMSNALLPQLVPPLDIPDCPKNGDHFMCMRLNVTESSNQPGFTLE